MNIGMVFLFGKSYLWVDLWDMSVLNEYPFSSGAV